MSTSPAKNQTVALMVDGVGYDESVSNASLLGFGDERAPMSTWDWKNALATVPSTIESSIDIFSGRTKSSRFTFNLHKTDELAKTFLHIPHEPETYITSDISDSSTTIDFNDVSNLSEGQVIYVGYEAIRLGSASGSSFTGCTRGHWHTFSSPWGSGEAAYLKLQYLRDRPCRLVTVDWDSQTVTTRWRGFVRAVPETSSNGTRIVIKTDEVTEAIKRAEINQDPRVASIENILSVQDVTYVPSFILTLGIELEGLIGPVDFGDDGISSVRKTTAWQSNGEIDLVRVGEEMLTWTRSGEFSFSLPLLASRWPDNEPQSGDFLENDVREVVIISPKIDATLSSRYSDVTDGVSPTINCTYPYHPITIFSAFCFSRANVDNSETPSEFDVLKSNWTLDIRWTLKDGAFDAIDDLIEKTSGIEIDYFEVGWEDDAVEIWKKLKSMMISYGFFPAFDANGFLHVRRTRIADLYDKASSGEGIKPLPRKAKWTSSSGSPVDSIVAEVGKRPWRESKTVTIRFGENRDYNNSASPSRIADPNEYKLDYSTIDIGKEDFVLRVNSDVARFRSLALPSLRAKFPDHEDSTADYGLGDFVQVLGPDTQDPVYYDNKGDPVDPSASDAAFLGMVVGRKYKVKSSTYELEILFLGHKFSDFVRLRAPSMVITGYDGSGPVRIYTDAASNFGDVGSDNLRFEAGYEVVYIRRDGFQHAAREVVATGSDGTGDYVEIDSALSPTPPTDGSAILRLADRTSFDGTVEGISDPFTYFGAGHIYG